jgi:predicted nucleotide-binding protein (sugar kinase/HSP70/actin superfamily)
VHNDIIGEALQMLQSGEYKDVEVAVGRAKFNCDCRLTNYAFLVRKALDEAGFSHIPIITTDSADLKTSTPSSK